MEYESKLIGVVAGVVFGIAPFLAGFLRNRLDLAFAGLIACSILGRIGGLFLSIPTSVVSTAVILYVTSSKSYKQK